MVGRGNEPIHPALLITILTLGIALAATPGDIQAESQVEPEISTAESRDDLALTIYNNDLALVRETRSVDLPEGEFRLEFRDVPERINPRSLLIEVADGAPLLIREQSYEYDLMSQQKILEKYVGRRLAWVLESGERIEGSLLSVAMGPVYEIDGEIRFEVPGKLALPELPGNLRARPTLVWDVASERHGERELDVSYLTGGIGWSADYVLSIDSEGERGGLQAWVTIDNQSGATFDDAELMLLAGDIHRAPPPMQSRAEFALAMDAKGGGNALVEEAVHDYHLYTLPRRTTLREREVKQLSFFSTDDIEVEKHYRLQAQPVFYRPVGGTHKEKISIFYAFEASRENDLYRALPAGTVRVYGRSGSGARQLLGSDSIDHTPRGETVELEVGKAFDLVAERVQTDYDRRGDRVHESAFEITLRNRSDKPVVVEVIETAWGEWRVLKSSHEAKKIDVNSLRFDVPIPPEGESVLTYRIQVTQ